MIIYQLKHQGHWQMMGYLVVADNGNVIMIDGGRSSETALAREILARHGNHIDLWFLTHPHPDHHEVFIEISKKPDGITADAFYHSPIDFERVSPQNSYYGGLVNFNEALTYTPFPVKLMELGKTFDLGNLHIEIMAVADSDISWEHFNNASCPIMITENYSDGTDFKLLFLGDLAIESGRKFLKEQGHRIKAHMVQMAHHGQNGAEECVYKAISPKYTLWPTPEWLWTNTEDPEKPGQGPYKTLITRGWMEALGATPILSLHDTAVINISQGNVTVSYLHDNY